MSHTIVLIHGLRMTPLSWEKWIVRHERAGHTVVAPSWSGLEGGVESLRRDPSPLAGLTVATILDHYEGIIRGLDTPPIIMGHSFGGAFTQVLLARGLGAAGVGVDSAATKGVLSLPLSTLRSSAHVPMNPFNINKAVPFSKKHFEYAFGNTMPQAESDAAHDRYSFPAAAHVLFEGALTNFQPGSSFAVDYARRDRAPFQFIGGGNDRVVRASTNVANARKYLPSTSTTGIHIFPGRSHFTVGQAGWEDVADYALDWASQHVPPPNVSRLSSVGSAAAAMS